MLETIEESGNFTRVYELMREAFPACETRPFEAARTQLARPEYRIRVLRENGEITAFIATWEFPGLRFIEHFAVDAARRGGGIGSAMLREYLGLSAKPVYIEVDSAQKAADETPEEKRRIRFYERLGFELSGFGYEQPTLREHAGRVFLRIMGYPSAPDGPAFLRLRDLLFTRVYGCAAPGAPRP